MEIRGLSALLMGASGFIGGRLAERLDAGEGVHVRAMVRNPERAKRLHNLQLKIVKGDLLDLFLFQLMVKEKKLCHPTYGRFMHLC